MKRWPLTAALCAALSACTVTVDARITASDGAVVTISDNVLSVAPSTALNADAIGQALPGL